MPEQAREPDEHPRMPVVALWALLGTVSGFGMALAAYLLIAPDISPPRMFPWQDKVFHILAFGCLTGPAALVLPARYRPFWLAHMLALGAGIEIAQGAGHNGRSEDLFDFLADAVGIGLALVIAGWIRSLVLRKAG